MLQVLTPLEVLTQRKQRLTPSPQLKPLWLDCACVCVWSEKGARCKHQANKQYERRNVSLQCHT